MGCILIRRIELNLLLEFRDELVTGVDKIDEQHKELFKNVNFLFNACTSGKGKAEIDGIITSLINYAETHFITEENAMIATHYKDYHSHRSAHEQFKMVISGIKKDLLEKGATSDLVVKTNKLMVNWLISHLNDHDKKMAVYLKEKNYKPAL